MQNRRLGGGSDVPVDGVPKFSAARPQLHFHRTRRIERALQEKSTKDNTARPGSLKSIDIGGLVFIQHVLQDEDPDERSGHESVLLGHQFISALQPWKDFEAIPLRGRTCAVMIFRVHCEAISKHEFDAFYFVPRGLETSRRCGDATLIAVPEMKMHADFREALDAYLSIWRDAKQLIILLQSTAQCQVGHVFAFGL